MAEDGTAIKAKSYHINAVEQKGQQIHLKSKYHFQKNVSLKAQVFLFSNKSLNEKAMTLKHKKPIESWILLFTKRKKYLRSSSCLFIREVAVFQ